MNPGGLSVRRRSTNLFEMTREPAREAATASVHAKFSQLARRDTAPELAVRRALHASGLRYRVEYPMPGAPRRRIDVAFPRQKLAVLIDGCFWHGCPEHRKPPARNSSWWEWKRATNEARDRDTDAKLREEGWRVLRIWEHVEPAQAVEMVRSALAEQSLESPNPRSGML